MSSFDPSGNLVVLPCEVIGPSGRFSLRLGLDTGATATMINTAFLVTLGYDPAASTQRVEVTTGSGVVFVPKVKVLCLSALGQIKTGFSVLCHTLPPSASMDGVLGLDFLRGHHLSVDFRAGKIDLT